MIPQFFLEVSELSDSSVKCTVTDQIPESGSSNVTLKITDTRLAALLQQADPVLKELIELVVNQAYNFGYNQAEFASDALSYVDFSALHPRSESGLSFAELYKQAFGVSDLDESDQKLVAARRAEFQAIEDEVLKHEPGSGVADLHFPAYKGDTTKPNV